jgi:hypothetical protein
MTYVAGKRFVVVDVAGKRFVVVEKLKETKGFKAVI